MSSKEITAVNKRSELVDVATAMLEGRMNLIVGVRKINALRHAVQPPDHEVFMPIRAVESETDHFPLGEIRKYCAADYLQKMDEEMNRYLVNAKQDIFSACKEIIRVFS